MRKRSKELFTGYESYQMKESLRISNFMIPVVRKLIISELRCRYRRETVQIDVMSGMGITSLMNSLQRFLKNIVSFPQSFDPLEEECSR